MSFARIVGPFPADVFIFIIITYLYVVETTGALAHGFRTDEFPNSIHF